jgi:hypothetical protein
VVSPCDTHPSGADGRGGVYLAKFYARAPGEPIRCGWQIWFDSTQAPDPPRALGVDDQGNAYSGGAADPVAPGATAHPGTVHATFLQKFATDGSLQWATDGPASDTRLFARTVAVDGSANPYVLAGAAYNAPGPHEFRLLKYDSSGRLLWNTPVGCCTPSGGTPAVVVDPDGIATLAADFDPDTRMPGAAPPTPPGSMPAASRRTFFVASVDPMGALRWTHAYGLPSDPGPSGVGFVEPSLALAPGGVVVLGGTNGGALDLGKGPLPTTGDPSPTLFLAAFDAAGSLLWTKVYPGRSATSLLGLASDGAGGIMLFGDYRADIRFDAQTLTSPGDNGSSFIARLSIP